MFAVRRLHRLLYGRHFVLRASTWYSWQTCWVVNTVAARLQRWAVILAMHDHSIQHIKGSENIVADFLSCSPELVSSEDEVAPVHSINEFTSDPCGDIPLSVEDVAKAIPGDSFSPLSFGMFSTVGLSSTMTVLRHFFVFNINYLLSKVSFCGTD